jgi:hypothetical protein
VNAANRPTRRAVKRAETIAVKFQDRSRPHLSLVFWDGFR